MAKIISFSEISNCYVNDGQEKYCLADTNFLIASIHDEHTFYTPSIKFLTTASGLGFKFFTTHTSRTEFLDIERKFSITRPLISLFNEEGRWKGRIKKESKEELTKSVDRIKKSKTLFDYFSDNELKDIKETFFAYNESGKIGWVNLCEEFISNNLTEAWDSLISSGINYFDIRKEEQIIGSPNCLVNSAVNWENMVSLVGKTAMGTSDAMIANSFLASKFHLLVTTDFDIAYGLSVDLDDTKIVAIPDALFKKNKQLLSKIERNRT